MAYIFLHPANLQTFINSLKDYATSASNELAAVRKSNNDNDDPAGVYYDISEYSTHATYHGELTRKADDLKIRLDEAVAMNNSGVMAGFKQNRIPVRSWVAVSAGAV